MIDWLSCERRKEYRIAVQENKPCPFLIHRRPWAPTHHRTCNKKIYQKTCWLLAYAWFHLLQATCKARSLKFWKATSLLVSCCGLCRRDQHSDSPSLFLQKWTNNSKFPAALFSEARARWFTVTWNFEIWSYPFTAGQIYFLIIKLYIRVLYTLHTYKVLLQVVSYYGVHIAHW